MDKKLEMQIAEYYNRCIEYYEYTPPFEVYFSKDMTDEKLKKEITELVDRLNQEYEQRMKI